MKTKQHFDVIIIGGSYSGLAAAMALGRALKKVLIIDSGKPCNAQTPHSHNFLTRDGETPSGIALIGKAQVMQYPSVKFFGGLATEGRKSADGFEIIASGEIFSATKLIFATGIRDILPKIDGFAESWGISVIHCPYCHGYEVRGERTGIFGNGETGFELATLISNWTHDLTLYTNGPATFTSEQSAKLAKHNIAVVEKIVGRLDHTNGHIENIVFTDGTLAAVNALYIKAPFEQHCRIPETLGCELSPDGYLKTDQFQETTVEGIYASGDNASRMRTVANAVAMGTAVGIGVSKKIIVEEFN